MAKKRNSRRPSGRPTARPALGSEPRALQYKVVELSTVDEGSLERAVNEWVARGFHFDGVQFAMRESSKRPSMAFVFFTRPGPPLVEAEEEPSNEGPGRRRRVTRGLVREVVNPATTSVRDAWARLTELATEGEDGP